MFNIWSLVCGSFCGFEDVYQFVSYICEKYQEGYLIVRVRKDVGMGGVVYYLYLVNILFVKEQRYFKDFSYFLLRINIFK